MIGLALLLAAAAPRTAVGAERAFAAMAQREGQWAAFRAFADPHAVMFVDDEVNAQAWLKDRKDPPQSVMWWPGKSFVSCDGRTAINTGPWVRQGGKAVGYFTTVWHRGADGSWHWLLDHGDSLARPRPASEVPTVRRASCRGTERPAFPGTNPDHLSRDGSVSWRWSVMPGERRFTASIWNGRAFETVIDDVVKTGP